MTSARTLAAGLLLLFLLSSAAYAGSAEDGNAGLDALNQGKYDQAITLFSRALADRRIAPDDRVLAYVSRGQAYLGKGDGRDASADFEAALRLRPGNADAKDGLQQAAALRATPAAPAPSWGILAQLAGTCWVTNPADPKSYGCNSWDASHTAIIGRIAERHGAAIQKFWLDPSAGVLFGQTTGTGAVYGTIDVSGNTIAASTYEKNTPIRDTVTFTSATAGTEVTEKYQNGAWVTVSSYPTQEVSKETVAAVRWAKKILG